jgi:hypothetical protein
MAVKQFDRPTMTPSEALAVVSDEADGWEYGTDPYRKVMAAHATLSAAVAENERLREALLDAQNRLSEIERNLGVASEDYYTRALTHEGQADER